MSKSYGEFVVDVANEIDLGNLAEFINVEDIDIEAHLQDAIDFDSIAEEVANNVDFQSMVDEWCCENVDIAEEIVAACINVALDKRKAAFKEEIKKDLIPMILAMVKQNVPKPWWHRLKFW